MTPDQALAEYEPMVQREANRLLRRLPPDVTNDDLLQAGRIGLIAACDSHRSSAPFGAYALIRIRGAMLDETRSTDERTRSERRSWRALAKAQYDAAQKLGRSPRGREVADLMGVTIEEYHRLRDAQGCSTVCSYDNDSGPEGEQTQHPSASPSPDKVAELGEMCRALNGAIDALPRKQRYVVLSAHRDLMTLTQIGDEQGFTASMACQYLGKGMARLRPVIAAHMQP